MRTTGLLLLVACGSDPVPPDAPLVVEPRCNPSTPFATPIPVAGVNTVSDDVSARLSHDELSVAFARRTGAGPYDLYSATRPSRDVPFGAPALMATVNSVNSEAWPSISPDGLLLVFDSNRSTGLDHIYVTRRASVTDPFTGPVAAPALMDRESHPFLANNRAMYFSSEVRTGQGLRDIWRTEIDSTGATSTPTAVLGGVNTPDEEITPAVTEDELRLFFRRTVAGEPDIYAASRTTSTDGFGTATPVPGLATPLVNEVPTWVSPDGCALYVHMNAPGGMGGEDIYVALRGSP